MLFFANSFSFSRLVAGSDSVSCITRSKRMLELVSEKYAFTSSNALTSAVSVDFPDEALTPLSGRRAPIFTESPAD